MLTIAGGILIAIAVMVFGGLLLLGIVLAFASYLNRAAAAASKPRKPIA